MAMKRAERDEWVAALRSGEYQQGVRRLDHDGKQCCLGVKCLLDIAATRNGVVRRISPGRVNTFEFGYFDNLINVFTYSVSMPMNQILYLWGITEDEATQLALLNDGNAAGAKMLSFAEIAQWIEDNIEVVD